MPVQSGAVEGQLKEHEKLGLMVACLCHDLDHRGTNNQFQVRLVPSPPLTPLTRHPSPRHPTCCLPAHVHGPVEPRVSASRLRLSSCRRSTCTLCSGAARPRSEPS